MAKITLSVTYTKTLDMSIEKVFDIPGKVIAGGEDAIFEYLDSHPELFDVAAESNEENEDISLEGVTILDEDGN